VKSIANGPVTKQTVLAWGWANLVANTLIILTGGLVRLTSSGLGCPNWPTCEGTQIAPHSALGWHGAIEFSNRLLTYVLIAIAIGAVIAVWRWPAATKYQRQLVVAIAIGIPFQGIIGGITVLTELNPWVVSLHLVLSMAIVIAATAFLISVQNLEANAPRRPALIVRSAYVFLLAAIYLGTIVTGSGPHAGDADAPRNGLNPEHLSKIHAWTIWLFIILTVIAIVQLSQKSRRIGIVVLIAGLAQGSIGYIQYFTDLPIALVAAHLIGAAMLLSVTTYWVLATRPEPR